VDVSLTRFRLALLALLGLTAALLAARGLAARDQRQAAAPPASRPALAMAAAPDPCEPDLATAVPLAERVTAADAEGRYQRVRIVRGDLKFPLLRIEERLRRGEPGAGPRLLARSVVAADHLMVGLLPGDTPESLAAVAAAADARLLGFDRGAALALIGGGAAAPDSLDRLRAALARLGREAEPDALVHAAGATPNGSFSSVAGPQWNLGRIAADQAWDFTTGSRAVLVGVIDAGIDYRHPDLAANIWTNPGESGDGREANGIDDDGDGYADDLHGYDFVAGGDPADGSDHGTHLAGIIGASRADRTGVLGVCWQVRLAALRILDRHGLGFTSDAIRAVRFATRIGCRVTNNAWCGGGYSRLLAAAIGDAGDHHVLFVAAAGNAGGDLGDGASYPASYQLDNLIAVAASDHDDQLAPFSGFGAAVHLVAPGVDVLSTVHGGYALRSGTSVAAAHVTGVCALLAAFAPELSGEQIRRRLLATVDPVPGLDRASASGGRVNAFRALAPIAVVRLDPAPGGQHPH
jgi:subtilisin family serine protease